MIAAAVLLAGVLPGSPGAAAAETGSDAVLADFETEQSLAGVTLASPTIDQAAQSRVLASRGSGSLRFDIAGFQTQAGSIFPRVWLAAGSTLADADWRAYDYLHVSVVNASPVPTTLYVVVRDRAGRYLQRGIPAAAFMYRAFQIKVVDIVAAGVDVANLQHIQVSTDRASDPKTLYVDDVRLTDHPSNEAAEQAAVAAGLIRAMELPQLLDSASTLLDAIADRILPQPAPADVELRKQAAAFREQLAGFEAKLTGLGTDVPAARALHGELQAVRWAVKRLGTFVDARRARPAAPVGLGFADSMSLVFPRDLPCRCSFGDERLQLAQGEYENVQLVALPYGTGLTGAKVAVTAVRGPGKGAGLTVSAHPVAALDMRPPVDLRLATPTEYRPSAYQGWTPDPILTDRASVDVGRTDMQAFWIEVRAGAEAEPGTYRVELEFTASGIEPQRVRFAATVWDFAIADRPKLRTAIGNHPAAYAEPYGITDPEGIAKANEAKWAFLGAFKLQPDNIYRSIYDGRPPTVAELLRIKEEYGGLRQFSVWYFDPRLFDRSRPDTWLPQADRLFDLIEPYVAQYRAAGLVDHAYLYCCDESRAEYFELIRAVLTRFKERFPDIEVLTTMVDRQMGRDNGLGELVDWWVGDVPSYARPVIERRHAEGREAWWYLHAGVRNPYPNLFVGHDPGQMRTLLGPMSYQAGVDGFLYYRVDRWYGHPVLADGPLSNWDPRTWGNVAGDGSLFYPGSNGPMPSIRLQNMRDGLEDYNLLAELRRAVDIAAPETDPGLLAKAHLLLTAQDVVTSNIEYVRDPGAYRDWRDDVAGTIHRLSDSE